LGASELRPELDPQPDRCCVVIIDNSQPAEATTAEATTAEATTAETTTVETTTAETRARET
jgi:hypothetical protein